MKDDRSKLAQHGTSHNGNQVHWTSAFWKELHSISETQNSIETLLSSIGMHQDRHLSLVNNFDSDQNSPVKSSKHKESTVCIKSVNSMNRKQGGSQSSNTATNQRKYTSYDQIMNLIRTDFAFDDNIGTLSSKMFFDITENPILKKDQIHERSRQTFDQNQVSLKTDTYQFNKNDHILNRSKTKQQSKHKNSGVSKCDNKRSLKVASNRELKHRQRNRKDKSELDYGGDIRGHQSHYEGETREEEPQKNGEDAVYNVISVSSPIKKQAGKTTNNEIHCNESKSFQTLTPYKNDNFGKNRLSKQEYLHGTDHSPSFNCPSVLSKENESMTYTNDTIAFSCYSKDNANCQSYRGAETPSSSHENLRVMKRVSSKGLMETLKKEIIESKSVLTEATLLLNKSWDSD